MGKKKIVQQSKEELLQESEQLKSEMKKASSGAPSSKKRISEGCAYVNATYNNTVITITDSNGNVLVWSSAGSLGFKGPKKSTPFAASKVAETVSEKMKKILPMRTRVYVKGIGSGRDSAIRTLANRGFDIIAIKDVTPIPHNGPRPPKPRRV